MSRDCLVLLFCHGLIKTCKQKYIHGFYIDLFLNRWSEAVLLSCNHASHSAMGGGGVAETSVSAFELSTRSLCQA